MSFQIPNETMTPLKKSRPEGNKGTIRKSLVRKLQTQEELPRYTRPRIEVAPRTSPSALSRLSIPPPRPSPMSHLEALNKALNNLAGFFYSVPQAVKDSVAPLQQTQSPSIPPPPSEASVSYHRPTPLSDMPDDERLELIGAYGTAMGYKHYRPLGD